MKGHQSETHRSLKLTTRPLCLRYGGGSPFYLSLSLSLCSMPHLSLRSLSCPSVVSLLSVFHVLPVPLSLCDLSSISLPCPCCLPSLSSISLLSPYYLSLCHATSVSPIHLLTLVYLSSVFLPCPFCPSILQVSLFCLSSVSLPFPCLSSISLLSPFYLTFLSLFCRSPVF